jgi:hypothetical protein
VSRQKLSLKGDRKPLNDEATLAELGVGECGELTVKDLGPQIKWRTVFLIEYVRDYSLFALIRLRTISWCQGWPSHLTPTCMALARAILRSSLGA